MDEDPRGTKLRKLPRLVDEPVGVVRAGRAVDETRVELSPRGSDRLRSLAKVRDVVQRVVEAKDVDPALGGTRNETLGELDADGAGTDEKPAAERHRERRRRPRLEHPDSLPRALDAATHGGLEAAAAGDLEVGEAGTVENLGEAQLLRRRQLPREGLLAEQAQRRIHEARHGQDLSALRPPCDPVETVRARLQTTLLGVAACALLTAAVASAARPPTHTEREAITQALPAFVRNVPVECVWLDIRVSHNPRYAYVGSEYLNATAPGSRCVRYARDGFFVLQKTTKWKVVYSGSDRPRCALGIPRDLVGCRP